MDDPAHYAYGEMVQCTICLLHEYRPPKSEIVRGLPCPACKEKEQARIKEVELENSRWFFKPWGKKSPLQRMLSISVVLLVGYLWLEGVTLVKYSIFKLSGREGTYYEYLQDEGGFWDSRGPR